MKFEKALCNCKISLKNKIKRWYVWLVMFVGMWNMDIERRNEKPSCGIKCGITGY